VSRQRRAGVAASRGARRSRSVCTEHLQAVFTTPRARYTRAVASADDNLFGDEHVRVYRETDGERGYQWRGTTILLLTTVGRKSGESRTTPLIHRTDDGRWVIVASKGGSPENPGWYQNLEANPEATIQVKGEQIPVRAADAEGDERTRLWSLLTEDWPDYDDYQTKTDRQIPVVVLSRR
jgi:deazaflavin-dependent oxidoreductase (nitroreductase family)